VRRQRSQSDLLAFQRNLMLGVLLGLAASAWVLLARMQAG
jgi:hypothetical protein